MKVAKFGGSSVATADRIRAICDVIESDADRRIVVVSAPGKAHDGDTKVTDLLIACAEQRLAGQPATREIELVIDRFRVICEDLKLAPEVPARVSGDLSQRASAEIKDPERFMAKMKAAGEDNSAWIIAHALQARGVTARYRHPGEAGMILSADYGNAVVLEESYANLASLGDYEGITVFPGFFGVTPDGDIATFPRGGSDITGAVVAAAVKADVYENFTDVDCVFSVDPRIVPEAMPIRELTYAEMRELSYAGFGVFHDEGVLPAVEAGIPICIRNTGDPAGPGTMVVPVRKHTAGNAVGIASSQGFCTVYVSKYLMNREIGIGRRMLQILEEEGLSYEHMPSGIDNMSVILREDRFGEEVEARLCARVEKDLKAEVSVERDLALIVIVGEGMRHSIGTAAKATGALATANVNIEMINQGSSEISMMFGVKARDRARAVESLYSVFFE
jgi:aspartate kinase